MNTISNSKNCWYLINQHQAKRQFETLEQKASIAFMDFISDKEYKTICAFWFDIYVENEINFGRQKDSFCKHLTRLSIHIRKPTFDKSSDEHRLILILNSTLVMLKYLHQKISLPKNFPAEKLAIDFEDYLINKKLISKSENLLKAIIKPFETTRFKFLISSTIEVKNKNIHYDLNEVEDFINNKLANKTFGDSIREFDLGYEIADPKGHIPHNLFTANIIRYRTKNKILLVVKQFDYRRLKELDKKEQFKVLKNKILDAITDVEKLKRKPKDFDKGKFFDTMYRILCDYENQL